MKTMILQDFVLVKQNNPMNKLVFIRYKKRFMWEPKRLRTSGQL